MHHAAQSSHLRHLKRDRAGQTGGSSAVPDRLSAVQQGPDPLNCVTHALRFISASTSKYPRPLPLSLLQPHLESSPTVPPQLNIERRLDFITTLTMVDSQNGASSSPTPDEESSITTNGHTAHTETTPLLKPNADEEGIQQGQASEVSNPQEEERTVIAQQMSHTKLALIMGTTWVGVFLGAADSTVIATLSAPISSEFKSLSLFSWLATAYFISNAACQPLSGRLTDIFGRGPGLVFSNIMFAVGNAICALARDEYVMIFGRVVAGMGGGGLMAISTFLGSDLVPLRNRGIVQGIGNLCYGTGAMTGGIIGGLINDHSRWGWRLAFMVQVPPVLASAVAVAYLVRVPPKQSDKSFLARIDFMGAFLTVAFLVLLLLGLNSAGNIVSWTHPLPLTTIPLSVVAFGGFIWWESRAKQPIIPVKLLATRTVLAACVCNLLCTMVVMTGLFYVPLYLQVLGNTSTEAGLHILPSPIGVSVGSLSAGYVMKTTGKYVKLGIGSVFLIVVGVTIFTQMREASHAALISVGLFCVGTGYGSMLTSTLLACIASVDHSQQAVVTSATCKYFFCLVCSSF